jgi:hypothetical protein
MPKRYQFSSYFFKFPFFFSSLVCSGSWVNLDSVVDSLIRSLLGLPLVVYEPMVLDTILCMDSSTPCIYLHGDACPCMSLHGYACPCMSSHDYLHSMHLFAWISPYHRCLLMAISTPCMSLHDYLKAMHVFALQSNSRKGIRVVIDESYLMD